MFVHRKQGLMDDIKMAGKKQKKAPMWKKLTKTCGHWRTHIISWPCILGLYSAWMQTEWINNWTKKEDVWIAYFCWSNRKITGMGKASRKDGGIVLWHGRTCLENALSDIASWQTRKWSNCTKFQVLAWMIINSSRRNSNQLENSQKFALKLSWNVCIWHELDDLTSCGRSMGLQDQSPHGLMHVTDDWQGWFHTFITQTISDNIVMCENTAQHCRLVFFKTQTLLVILMSQNQLQEVTCVCLEVENICSSKLDVQEADCCLTQFYRVWNHFSGCQIACGWVTCSRSLGRANWSVTFNKQHCPTQPQLHQGNLCKAQFQNQEPNWQEKAEGWSIVRCGLCSHKHTFFSRWVSVVDF